MPTATTWTKDILINNVVWTVDEITPTTVNWIKD